MPVEVVFFNVGQGDCTFLWFYDKPGDTVGTHAVLIDCGSSQQVAPLNPFQGKTGMVDRLDSRIGDYMARLRNPDVLDCLIITHPDKDHFNLLRHVLQDQQSPPRLKYQIRAIRYGLTVDDYKEGNQSFVHDLIELWTTFVDRRGRRGVVTKPDFVTMPVDPEALVTGTRGAELLMVGAAVGVDPRSRRKYPKNPGKGKQTPEEKDEEKRTEGEKEKIANESSLVTLLQGDPEGNGDRQRVLLMADAVKLNEDYLGLGFAGGRLKRQSKLWLKLGHHGSRTSNTDEWLNYTTPDGLFVSTGVLVFSGGSGTFTDSNVNGRLLKTWKKVLKNNNIPPVNVSSGQQWGYVVHDDSNRRGEFIYAPTTDGLFSSMAMPPVRGGTKARGDAANWRGVDWHLRLDDPRPGSYEIWYE
ncbi:MBL fold metallo-hydrolase [Streptomyces albireticuli]|uniref:Uncharacterized protein n=1 Tax=Streptomyces albireticuli TaxID=1940 RepID=A0A2A2CY57_9ACTN|nr:MBL fold metallo-hydrolase [Streptomyces albireticuli]MCD9141408.1 MBL fold metallo-hydrolase [Streptomyces albireticuli]MCD9160631.1 MBL fold metallo-hydrolase [Streptomyces albireticuli]MCD9195813.1 MBL fold metallo-hydrolase [Streptomyces albireticuli]PAU44137.1 hypothetical protein CK936_36455 [Streptomyces albireticuli]